MQLDAHISHIATGHSGAIYSLAINRDTGIVYSGSGDGMVASWDAVSGQQIKAIAKNDSPVFSLYFNAENHHIYIGDQNGYLHVINTITNALLSSSKIHELGLYCSVFHAASNSIFTGGGDGLINKLDADLFHLKANSPLTTTTNRSIVLDANLEQLLVGSSDNKIYNVSANALVKQNTLTQHKNSVFVVCVVNDRQFLSSGRDAEICVWTQEEDNSFTLEKVIPAHLMTVNNIRLSPNGKLFASVSRDKTIKIWRSSDQKLLKVLDADKFPDMHNHSINDIAWYDDYHFISASDDKKLIYWKLEYNIFD